VEDRRLIALSVGGLAVILAPTPLLWRSVRVLLARRLPLEPDTFRHWLGLAALFWFAVLPFALLPLLGDRPPLEALYDQLAIGVPQGYDWMGDLGDLSWKIVLSLVAVGFPLARSLSGARLRLGLTWPGWRVLAIAVLLSLLMVPLLVTVDWLLTSAVASLGLPTARDGWTDRLFGTGHGPGAVFLIGLTAGVGEELIWRGVLQPRYGLILTTLSFTAIHAFQYGAGALVSVFLAGLVLGLVRQRTNTTTSMVVHASYDIWLIAGLGEGVIQVVTWLARILGAAPGS
jgi:membrane protease YdiL (CAAX protease family)